ncbi:hypothetical protein F5Y19DRAFT_438983 [Xylariaceae sp. FL1651]|nr:hypothetical protein F5Y19DRAFT_438983 [Xylariaceae sp. FL1651]
MSVMSPANALPLEAFDLAVFPRAMHNVTWSPDAELAIACDDCVVIYAPEFSLLPPSNGVQPGYEEPRQYAEATLRFSIAPLQSPELNRHLFDVMKQEFTGYTFFTGGGSGVITGHGSSLNHTIALGWSPCGLGRMNRAVLAVLTGAGIVTIYCQGASDELGSVKIHGRNSRSLRPWIAAWCVGGGMLVPAAEGHEPIDKKEYITAFSWARDTHNPIAILSYLNDDDEIVLLSVQARHNYDAGPGHSGEWKVQEVARFMAGGPHPKTDPTDPDYTSSNSSFALSWGPWLDRGSSKTSIISYVSHNYIGFRQVTIYEADENREEPGVYVDQTDASGICLHLAPDAFVVWEDLVWTISGSKVCRGIIATPTRVQAFELPFDSIFSPSIHKTDECGTTYPSEEDNAQIGNPITGLIIHPPSPSQSTSTPSYSLVRLSATHENTAWHQTNLPLSPNPEDHANTDLRWATEISQIIEHQLPRALAHRPMSSTGKGSGEAEFSSDEDELDSEIDEDAEYDSEDDTKSNFLGIRGVDTADQVHLNRIRIWGMTSSLGGGTSAVFISRHSTIETERDTFAGLKCRVLFGTHARMGDNGNAAMSTELSTEAKAWEWMYGGGPPVPGISLPAVSRGDGRAALKDHFDVIARRQVCVFCELPLAPEGKSSRCSNGHVFEICANTGVPVLAPNVSHTCGVCGMKCLKPKELVILAPQLKDIIEEEISAELCGGCGGKFTN